MDWATNDYTKTFADTIYVPEPDADAGVYLLDEAGRGSDPWERDRLRAPIRPFGGRDGGPYGGVGRVGPPFRVAYPPGAGPRGPPLREGYYTGGNIISAPRDNLYRIFGAAWDERPQHYNPKSGADWAQLVPRASDRPRGGGPAPSLAFPMIPHSMALDNPWNNSAPTAPSRECDRDPPPPKEGFGGAPAPGCGSERSLQLVKVFLLILIVVLLAMTLMAAGRLARALEKAVSEAVGLLGTAAAP